MSKSKQAANKARQEAGLAYAAKRWCWVDDEMVLDCLASEPKAAYAEVIDSMAEECDFDDPYDFFGIFHGQEKPKC